MNFFEHQDRARRNTGRLVALFAVAVIGLVAGAYGLVIAVLVAGESPRPTAEAAVGLQVPPLWRPEVFAAVALGVGGVVGAGSLYKTAQLAGGGEPLAPVTRTRSGPSWASSTLVKSARQSGPR